MSLRKPQAESLKILDDILDEIELTKNQNLDEALEKIKSNYPTCRDFERKFVSLTFALATGVGKTRLMGAFIAYLYKRHGIKNFFVVAPNTTIYEKIKNDLQQSDSPKYIFKGLDNLFMATPAIFSEDDYRTRQGRIDDVAIYLYNIDKFNKENAKMREENENLGDSFFKHLSKIPDLVLIMDESHHYRAEKGAAALNELNPVLGLELTATPIVNKGKTQEKFKNVVYQYPLSKAIEDGYTRTPYAMTRANINFQNFGEDFTDEAMLNDGIKYHEKVKMSLMLYADAHKKRLVKPFMLVVCKDTGHAAKIESYIKSERFQNGNYANKVIKIDSKQKKSESDENIKLLLDVENSENPIEIVIHVNMLKEGWDVNNLYTIVPLRTAASKILREQMVGRGLRLPYGTRTGDNEIDSVMLTAHDKFDEIIEEAARG
ncbi:MAG: DEAD/DEAH box helicase family protein, partial [Synergistaceae bacterium]|nr:DEAD/DEAH box helicase family protein [Synergistaceae bacterium]